MKTKEELKKYFENGDIPKQEEFWEWQESYWHKDEKLPLDKVAYDFSQKADLVGGVIPASQLPSYVDDVLEFDALSNLPQQGESGKIYITKDTNKLYRWTGARYIDITQGELATLQSVTERGNETTQSINIQGINYGGFSQFNNIIIGEKSEELNSLSNNIIAIGKGTNPLGTEHLVIGHNAGGTDSGSDSNTIIGNFSFRDVPGSGENTVVGHFSFNTGKGAQANTVFGTSAGNSGGTEIMENIIIGCRAGTELGTESKNNIIIGGNSGFNNTQLQNSLYIHNNNPGSPAILSEALISGNFVNKYVNLNGKFSITPDQMPTADASYTKNIVARPDGTFGWEDKIFSEFIPLAGTAFKKPVTGDIVFDNTNGNRELKGAVYGSYISFLDDGVIEINNKYNAGSNVRISGIDFVGTAYGSSGMIGSFYYGDSYEENSFIQKKYSDKQHSYTTKEEKTGGLWINNKPVYKKTFFLDQIPRTGEIPIDKIFEDMEVIVSNQMFTEWYAIDVAFAGNQWMRKAFITLENKMVRFELVGISDYDYSLINSFALPLEYTKKNDTPV